MEEGAKVLDIATGSGAVPRAMQAVRTLYVEAVDYAPAGQAIPGVRLHSGVDAARLPFGDGSFEAITSQFGIEYAAPDALREAARVSAPGGEIRLIVHHTDSPIVGANVARRHALEAVARSGIMERARTSRLQQNGSRYLMHSLWTREQRHPVIEEIAAALHDALGLGQAERVAEIERLQHGLDAELCILGGLEKAACDRPAIERLVSQLAGFYDMQAPQPLTTGEAGTGEAGLPLAWQVAGHRTKREV